MHMKLTSVSITEKPAYLRVKGTSNFYAKCTIEGQSEYNAGITIDIPEEQLKPIVDIMQRLVAENMAASAAAFAADVQASIGAATVEHQAIAAPTPPDADDEVLF